MLSFINICQHTIWMLTENICKLTFKSAYASFVWLWVYTENIYIHPTIGLLCNIWMSLIVISLSVLIWKRKKLHFCLRVQVHFLCTLSYFRWKLDDKMTRKSHYYRNFRRRLWVWGDRCECEVLLLDICHILMHTHTLNCDSSPDYTLEIFRCDMSWLMNAPPSWRDKWQTYLIDDK